MKIRKGDTVCVIAGKSRGKEGKVLEVFLAEDRVLVEGVNRVTRHLPKQGTTPGQRVEMEKPIHVSNVMFKDPATGKPTRLGYEVTDGKKTRIAKKTGKTV